MSYTSFLGVLIAGLLADNCLVANCTGADVTMMQTKSYKNASIYSLIIFAVTLCSSIVMSICSNILAFYGLHNLAFIISMVVVAVFVQLAEFVCKKVCPIFIKQTKYFVPILAGTEMMFMVGLLSASISFGYMLLYVLFNGLGVWMVLLAIAGIKKNFTHSDTKENSKGLVLSLTIVFVLALIFSAF